MTKMTLSKIGDPRAELDHTFLDKAFYETPEFKTIMESPHRKVVVGRRGTGKSALFYQMKKTLSRVPHLALLLIEPTDDQMIGLRHFASLFGESQGNLRAAAQIAWQHAVIMEILGVLCEHYKVKNTEELAKCAEAVRLWRRQGPTIVHRMVTGLEKAVDVAEPPDKRVAGLSRKLNLENMRTLAASVAPESRLSFFVVADRLDEGFEPSAHALAVINGLLYAMTTVSSAIPMTRCVAFVRDNILRTIQENDPDFTRNTEGDVLRLHWDEAHLFNMICNRIRTAFSIDQEQNLRAWNAVTDRTIQGSEGFRKCLRLTLYRPRDLVLLLNRAFYNAASHDRTEVVDQDIDVSAKDISSSRLTDLKREYGDVIPGLGEIIACFVNGTAEIGQTQAEASLAQLFSSVTLPTRAAQDLAILGGPEEVIRQLYSIGFLGVWHAPKHCFVFSHDGKQPDFSVECNSRFLIHPCYWVAMNLQEREMQEDEAQEIHDDYDIEVTSETPEIRKRRLGQLIAELDQVPMGSEGSSLFEEWCLKAIRVAFAGTLVNIEHHPNHVATQRRDIVGRNTGTTETWKRILDDYGARQIVFEAKNFDSDLGQPEYQQMLSYMCAEHGNLCFIVNRAESTALLADRELVWCREIYHEHDRKVVVKLPAKQLVGWISKLRNPQRHDAPDKGLGGLLDRYERMYLHPG
jgi:hypothetical protein